MLILFASLLGLINLKAQENILENDIEHVVPFKLFKSSSDTVTGTSLSKINYEDLTKFGTTDPRDVYIAQLDFKEYQPILQKGNDQWILQIGYLNRASLFYKNGTALDSVSMGSFELNSKFTGAFSFGEEKLIDGRYLFLKFSKLNSRQQLNNKQFVFYRQSYEKYREDQIGKKFARTVSFSYLLWGAVFVGIVMSMVFYWTYKRPEYIYYSLYAVSLAMFLGRYGFGWYETYVGNFSFTTFLLNNTFELLAGLFYVLFEKYFLETRREYPLLDKAINISIAIFLLWLVIDTTFILMGKYHLHFVLLDIRALLLSVLVIFGVVYLLINLRNHLNWFVIVGSFIFALGSLFVYASGNGNYLRLAAVVEITVFSLGLGYKVRVENKEKLQVEKEVSITYLRLLRSQLNPHFIFNALSSIQHLVMTGNQVESLHYLNKFSKLMRYVLESSKQENALLSEEVSFLEKYISLESLRFQKEFDCTIEIEPPLQPDNVEVPLLVTQPFVENAILHGLLPKVDGKRSLSILFRKANGNMLQCIIEDNGIGRAASEKNKSGNKEHRSMGIAIMEERLNALRMAGNNKPTVFIEDKYDDEGQSLGTRVTLNFFLD